MYECQACGLLQADLQASDGFTVGGLENIRREITRKVLAHVDHKFFTLKGKTLLDVGCAVGYFLSEAKEWKLAVKGIEPNIENFQAAKEKGLDVTHGYFPDVIDGEDRFNVISFNDVFEHIPQPLEMLDHIHHLLKDDGLVIFNVPVSTGFFYKLSTVLDKLSFSKPLERMWQVNFPSPHLFYYSQHTMQTLLKQQNKFEIIQSFDVPAINETGLKDRVTLGKKGACVYAYYLAMLVLVKLAKILPKDNRVFFLKKKTNL